MCSPVLNLPSYKEPPQIYPCIPILGPKCLPCGMDPVTLRRPLIVHDSTFDYRPTSWPGMTVNNQDKKVRYQLINYERPKNRKMCDRMSVIGQLQTIMTAIRGGGCPGRCCAPPCCSPCCGGGSLVTVYNAVLAIGQPPQPVAAFDKATIAIGHHGPNCKAK